MAMTASAHSPLSDAQLIAGTLQGDDQAFHDLVRRYQGVTLGCCRAITRHDADAADAAQEAFIRLHRNLEQFDPARPLKPYLLKIAANCSRTLVSRRVRLEQRQASELELERLADQRRGPAGRLLRGERRRAIRQMIDELPETLRAVCSLFYLGECSCREVAGILEMSETAVKVALHRARRRLQQRGVGEWRTV